MDSNSPENRIRNARAKVGKLHSNASSGYAGVWEAALIFAPSLVTMGVEAYRFLANPNFLARGLGWGDVAVTAVALLGTIFGGIKGLESWNYSQANTQMAERLEFEIDLAELKGNDQN